MKWRIPASAAVLLVFLPRLFAFSTFTGHSEMYLALRLSDVADDPGTLTFPLDLSVHFDGQFDIGDFLFARTSLAATALDAMPEAVTGKVGNQISVMSDEISLSLHLPTLGGVSYIAAFVGGNYESPGTDSFLGKYFGTPPFSSLILQNRLFQNGLPIYYNAGTGISYHIRFPAPVIASITAVIPNDSALDPLDERTEQFDLDFRVAGVADRYSLDFSAGLSLFSEGGVGHYRAALTWYTGSRYDGAFLFQAGIHDYTPKISLDNIYLVIEPRFVIGNLNLDLRAFMLPDDTNAYDDIIFVHFANNVVSNIHMRKLGAAGVGFSLYNGNLYLGSLQSKLALHLVAGLDTNIGSIIVLDGGDPPVRPYDVANHLHVQISPEWTVTMKNGLFSTVLTVDPMNKKQTWGETGSGTAITRTTVMVSDMLSSIRLRVGYVAYF